jgi:hypothetical protein
LEKLPSRQKVAMLETAKTRQSKPDVALDHRTYPGPSFSPTSIEATLLSPVELDPTTEVPLISPIELAPTTAPMVDSDPDAAPMVPAAAPMVI